MASHDRLPKPLDCSNLAKEWTTWKRTFMVYMIANNKINEPERQKIATFLWLIGSEAGNIYNTLYPNDGTLESIIFGQVNPPANAPINAPANEPDNVPENAANQNEGVPRTLEIVLKAFDDYCLPRKNIAMESYKFNTVVQKENQTFADFETELRTQLQFCEYNCVCGATYEHRMLRDRIIIGVYDKKLQLKLLDGKDDPLKNVIETCKIYEAANANKILLDRRNNASTISAVSETTTDPACNAVSPYCFNSHQIICSLAKPSTSIA